MRATPLLFALLCAGAPAAHAQHTMPAADSTAADSAVPLYDNLGDYSRRITTLSPEAQAYFDQGVRLTYGFGHPDAVRAFRAALDHDSACAMCWWGIAWARGPYINSEMDSASAVEAYAAVQQAVRLRDNANAAEQALIDAMAARYVASPEEERAALDSVYARAMADVVRRYPHDLDAATLYGEALMVLRPWDLWTVTGEPKPGAEEVVAVLESVLARDLMHPGACHLYIHAVEASQQPERAEACAEHLGARIPGASHVPHMPSHIFMRIGRYGDAVVGNRAAWHVDQQAAYGGPPGIYPSHNLHMMMTAATFDGQSAIALQAARDLARDYPWNAFYPAVMLVRFGRWREALELPEPDTAMRLHEGMWRFARGHGYLGTGSTARARVELAGLDYVLEATDEDDSFRGHRTRDLLGIARAILAGELALQEGRNDEAVRLLEAALPLEDSLTYDEPEPWPFPVRHVLGAALLESGRATDAVRVYREALQDHPHNGWSLAGLALALRASADGEREAAAVEREFAERWQRADVWLRGSRFAPRPPEPAEAARTHHE